MITLHSFNNSSFFIRNTRYFSNINKISYHMPKIRPESPNFSSGPCKKRPGYNLNNIKTRNQGRSHRSKVAKNTINEAINKTKDILKIPDDYLVGIVPASDTGAYEMAMWSTLGSKDVDVAYWESFGKIWFEDAVSQLRLRDNVKVNEITADFGELPDLNKHHSDNDLCFTFNGTTSGVRVPSDCSFINDNRKGITICDATSGAFAMDLPWKKLDITTYSWQKVLGGEAGHGTIILSPRAVERLENYSPNRPIPKIFQLTNKGKLNKGIFEGVTINTPSMLAIEDYIDALDWAREIGGLDTLIKRSNNNFEVIENFVNENSWINFLAKDPLNRSTTSVCLTLDLTPNQINNFVTLLEDENVAFDIGGYRDAPPSLRIWCGSTVEKEDVKKLMPWLTWAFNVSRNNWK